MIDFKAAYDSIYRDELYRAMSSFGIPAKLVRLCRMTIENTRCSIKVGNDLTETFEVKKDLDKAMRCHMTSYLKELCETHKPTPVRTGVQTHLDQ